MKKSLIFKGFQHYFRHLPWQMKSTRIIYYLTPYLSRIFLIFPYFLGHLRTFSVCRLFSHFSAFIDLSRHVSSFKWSKIWSKMVSDFKFRPLHFRACFRCLSAIFQRYSRLTSAIHLCLKSLISRNNLV